MHTAICFPHPHMVAIRSYLEGLEIVCGIQTIMRQRNAAIQHFQVQRSTSFRDQNYSQTTVLNTSRIACGVDAGSRPARCMAALRFDRTCWRVSAHVKIV
jgi:hypothetical protein